MEVGLDDQFDGQTVGGRIAHVLVDVASRIDHHGAAGRLVADQIGGL
jgi:hypothetical protein